MKDFLIDVNTKNLIITNRDLTFTTSDSEYIAQKLRIRLSIVRGEWYLNNQIGLPYFEEIFVKNPNLSYIEDLIKIEIKAITGVNSIKSFTLNYDNITRVLSVIFTAQLTNGELVTVSI